MATAALPNPKNPLMLTYPGYDTPDGRSLPKTGTVLGDLFAMLAAGKKFVIPKELLRPPAPEPPLPDNTEHEPWQIVVYDEEEAQRQTALYEAKQRGDLAATMKALLELSENYRRAQFEEAKRLMQQLLKKLEQERKEREERERREAERQEMIRQQKLQREADAKSELTAYRQKWNTFRGTFLLAVHLPDLVSDLLPMENAGKWGQILRCISQREEFMRTALALLTEYQAMVASIANKPYLQTRFNVLLTGLAVAIAQDPVGTKNALKVDHLKNEVRNEVQRYAKIYSGWEAALETSKKRLDHLPKDKRFHRDKTAAIQAFGMAILNDPYGAGHNGTLKAINDEIDKEVERPIKEEEKNKIYRALYKDFVAKESSAKLAAKRYTALASYEKGLIRMIRGGQAADSAPVPANGRNVLWERKGHDFSGPLAPGLTSARGERAEYRLWQDIPGRVGGTSKFIGATTWYLTGERMTSFGRPGTDRILFFYNQHTPSNQYLYGLVTHMPMRANKAAPKQRYFPEGYPAAPGPVA